MIISLHNIIVVMEQLFECNNLQVAYPDNIPLCLFLELLALQGE